MKYGKKGYIVQERSGRSLSKLLSEIQGVFYKNERVYEVHRSISRYNSQNSIIS